MSVGHVLFGGEWVPYEERPSVDPFSDEEPLVCGLETPEVCESCQ